MAETAFLFPGQGSQYVGMGKAVFEGSEIARATFETADRTLGFSLTDICFNGPEEKLRETRFTQPAILVHSVAVWRIMDAKGLRAGFAAGHSVGEYSALVAAGALAFEDALRLVKIRGEAMFRSGVETPGAMAALIGISESDLAGLLEEARDVGILEPANYNSPVQTVISGDVEAVEKAVEIARNHGAKRAIRLNVSGAFHSPLMEAAEAELAEALAAVAFRQATLPVVSNVTAEPATEPGTIADLLRSQLRKPVRWQQSMEYLVAQGVDLFVEVGPGSVLCGLMKRISPDVRCIGCGDMESIDTLVGEVTP